MTKEEMSTKDTLVRHLDAFGNNDMEAIMADYTDESQLLSINGTHNGLTAIREFFKVMFNLIPSGSFFEMKQLTVSGNIAHIIWASKSETANIVFGSDTFVIEDDKIISHTVAAHLL